MVSPSRYFVPKRASQGNLQDEPKWRLSLRKENEGPQDSHDRDIIKARLANVNAATLFSKNKIRLAMQGIYRAQHENRQSIASDFEISLAEIGMYRERNRRVVQALEKNASMERAERQKIDHAEYSFRDWLVNRKLKLLKEELVQRISIERWFEVSVVEAFTQESAHRHFLYISESEQSIRLSIAASRDSEIMEMHEYFHFVKERTRFFIAATSSLMGECSLKSREIISQEENERSILNSNHRKTSKALTHLNKSRKEICRHETADRETLSEKFDVEYSELLQDWRYKMLHILERTKRIYSDRASIIEQEITHRVGISDSESPARSSLYDNFLLLQHKILAFIDNAALMSTERYHQAEKEKVELFHFSSQTLKSQVDGIWESYRTQQKLQEQRRILAQRHFEETQFLFTTEHNTRKAFRDDEGESFIKIMNLRHTDGSALVALLESFEMARTNLFDEWHVLALHAREKQQNYAKKLAQHFYERLNFENIHRNDRVWIENSQEDTWSELMLFFKNARASVLVLSAMTELEAFESYERNAMSIAEFKSLSNLHCNFISEQKGIDLLELEKSENEKRAQIEGDFMMSHKEFYDLMPTPRGLSVEEILDNIEHTNALGLLRSELDLQDHELGGISIVHLLLIARLIERIQETEFEAFQACEKLENEQRAYQTKMKAKYSIIKSLSEDISDAKMAIMKHRTAQKARQQNTKVLKQQRKLRAEMIKKRRDHAEKEVQLAIEERERTRDRVRDQLRGQKSSPLPKRGKMY